MELPQAMPATKRGRPTKGEQARVLKLAQQLAEQMVVQQERGAIFASKKRSGLKRGVSKTDTGMFQARIKQGGTRYNLGSFPSEAEASAAYEAAMRSGVTCASSPKKRAKRGTGAAVPSLTSLATC